MSLSFNKPKQPKGPTQEDLTAKANLELLIQELQPMWHQANKYFHDFTVNGKRRFWLLGTETIGDLAPERVEYVLKYLDYFKRQIQLVELPEEDDLRFDYD